MPGSRRFSRRPTLNLLSGRGNDVDDDDERRLDQPLTDRREEGTGSAGQISPLSGNLSGKQSVAYPEDYESGPDLSHRSAGSSGPLPSVCVTPQVGSEAGARQGGWARPEAGGEEVPELHRVVQQTTVVTEMLDAKTLSLVKDMSISKYITSNEMTAQLLALISCAPDRVEVYRELLWPGGNTFNIRPTSSVLSKNAVVDFYEASELVMATGEVLLGYMERGTGNTIINPHNKSARNISRSNIDVLVTIAWGSSNGEQV